VSDGSADDLPHPLTVDVRDVFRHLVDGATGRTAMTDEELEDAIFGPPYAWATYLNNPAHTEDVNADMALINVLAIFDNLCAAKQTITDIENRLRGNDE
jgi:hypothetical protein